MQLPPAAACGLENQYPVGRLEVVERLNFIRDGGELERVTDGHAFVHSSGNAAILVWAEEAVDALPDWVVPGEPGEVDSVVGASAGEVDVSFDVRICGTREGSQGAVFLQFEGP